MPFVTQAYSQDYPAFILPTGGIQSKLWHLLLYALKKHYMLRVLLNHMPRHCCSRLQFIVKSG